MVSVAEWSSASAVSRAARRARAKAASLRASEKKANHVGLICPIAVSCNSFTVFWAALLSGGTVTL